jgi:hypothetical protein
LKNYALHLLRTVLLPTSTVSPLSVDAFGLLLGLLTSLPSLTDRPSEPDEIKGVPQFNHILVKAFVLYLKDAVNRNEYF